MSRFQSNKPKVQKKRLQTRVAVLFIVIVLIMIAVLVHVIVTVIKNKDDYAHKTLAQMTNSGTTLVAAPGDILDCNGNVLATSYKVYLLILDGKVMQETETLYPGSLDATVELLSSVFGIEEEKLRDAYANNADSAYYRFPSMKINADGESEEVKKTVLSQEQVDAYHDAVNAFDEAKKKQNAIVAGDNPDQLKKITARIVGVWFEDEYRREYPQNSLLSKVIGYTTEDTTEGLNGLSYYYNNELNGTNGKEYTYINSQGQMVSEVVTAQQGYTLQTSLDTNVAKIVKEAMDEFFDEMGGKRAHVLVMNPNTGEVIAMVSDTDYDLNNPTDLSSLFTEEELADPSSTFLLQEAYQGQMDLLEQMTTKEQLSVLLQQVQRNYEVSNTYEPGSTGKTFTLATAIETGAINQDTQFYCDGALQIGGYTIRCHIRDGCGVLNPMEAFGASCNVSFMKIGQSIGKEWFAQYQRIFDFGQKTGIDLPGEANTSKLIYDENQMNITELSTNAFGQGYNVTMIQLASAFSSVVNGGVYYQPHIVKAIVDENGNTIKNNTPTAVRTTISKETSDYMREALTYVTEQGTASGFNENGYVMMGKTGAAEKLPRGTGKYVVSFIGAAPVDNPQFVIYSVVDEPYRDDQSDSLPARLLTQKVLKKLYSYYNIYPDNSENAYSFNWDTLRNDLNTSDSIDGSFMDDPNQTFPWLVDTENETDSEEESTIEEVPSEEESTIEEVPSEEESTIEEVLSEEEPVTEGAPSVEEPVIGDSEAGEIETP